MKKQTIEAGVWIILAEATTYPKPGYCTLNRVPKSTKTADLFLLHSVLVAITVVVLITVSVVRTEGQGQAKPGQM